MLSCVTYSSGSQQKYRPLQPGVHFDEPTRNNTINISTHRSCVMCSQGSQQKYRLATARVLLAELSHEEIASVLHLPGPILSPPLDYRPMSVSSSKSCVLVPFDVSKLVLPQSSAFASKSCCTLSSPFAPPPALDLLDLAASCPMA